MRMDYTNLSNEELERLVNSKDGEAICELGERCMYGVRGHEVNLTRAYQLFHKGEKLGLPKAYIGLGEMYRNGIRFMKNEEIAREYYQKAGVPYPNGSAFANGTEYNVSANAEHTQSGNGPSVNYTESADDSIFENENKAKTPGVSDVSIREKLKQAEVLRATDKYNQAKIVCNEAIRMIDSIYSGIVTYTGREDIDDILIDAYWMMAYIAFNEQRYQDMEDYLAKEGVLGLHPWGVYLSAISHKVIQSPDIILEQDLQTLITVSHNQNLTQQERGDVCTMIGDLLQEGYGKSLGIMPGKAKSYYQEAMNCGNEYAREQYRNMQ